MDHLPVIVVLVPLLGAPVCVLLRHPGAVKLWAVLIAWSTCAASLLLGWQVAAAGRITYPMGGWPAPVGIVYEIDALNALLIMIVAGSAAVIVPYTTFSLTAEVPAKRQYLLYSLFLLCIAGLLGIAATGDLFNVFVFLEIASLSSYALIGMGRSRRGFAAAFQYLIIGTIGSTFILIGIGFLYMVSGTLNMADLAARLADLEINRTVLAGFAFLTVGISIKMALFPLHNWLPNAYTYAPSSVSAFIASTSTKVSLYVFLRVIFCIFGVSFAFGELHLHHVLLPLALTAIVVASTIAIFQENVKRLLAYSSVAQIGYMVVGVALANQSGLTGTVIHMMNHALMKGGLFLAVGCLILRFGSPRLQNLRGAGRAMPWTSLAVVIGGLNLIGVPLTGGFISKWYLLAGSIEAGNWTVAAFILVGSLLAAIYAWRIVETLYFATPVNPGRMGSVREAPLILLAPTWVMMLGSLGVGVYAVPAVEWANRAAQVLMRGVLP